MSVHARKPEKGENLKPEVRKGEGELENLKGGKT
jgi:hypothetical protein